MMKTTKNTRLTLSANNAANNDANGSGHAGDNNVPGAYVQPVIATRIAARAADITKIDHRLAHSRFDKSRPPWSRAQKF